MATPQPVLFFHLSPELCPSTAGCSPPSTPSVVFRLSFLCLRWFPPSLLCRLAIVYLVVPLSLPSPWLPLCAAFSLPTVCVLFIGIVQRNWACLTWKSAVEIKSLLLLLLLLLLYITITSLQGRFGLSTRQTPLATFVTVVRTLAFRQAS